jgi:hypothetical protein
VDCDNLFWPKEAKRAAVRDHIPCASTVRYLVCHGSLGGSKYADTLSLLPKLLQYR